MSTVIRGRIPEHATLRYQEESVDDVQIPYDITFKLVGYESVQIEKQIKAIREAIKKKKTTKFWTLSDKGGGVSAAAKLFIDERYGHVHRGGGGWSSSSKLVFCIKVCFVGT